MSEQAAPRYRFGPLEERGFLLGLRLSQVLLLLVPLVVGVVLFWLLPSWLMLLVDLMALLLAGVVCFCPWEGRSLQEWIPIHARFGVERLLGGDRHIVHAPLVGHTGASPATVELPPSLRGLEILTAPVRGGGELGVIRDRGRHTYAAVLLCRGRSFALLDSDEQARKLNAWGDVLSAVGRDGSVVERLQWLDVVVPDDGEAAVRHLRRHLVMPVDSAPVRSLVSLLEDAAPVSQVHETHLVVRINASHPAVRRLGTRRGEEQAACTVLAQQLAGLSDRLRRADIVVEGVLTPRRVARIIRLAYDPAAREPIARAGIQGADPGVDPSDAWPMGTHDLWSMLRTDSAVHRTYWVRQWPRTEVGPDWLSPPLLGCGRHMRVSMVIEPVDLARAGRAVPYRHTAHITVTAATPDALEVACIDVEQSAIAARLQLRRMVGEQADAFTLTLPLCRGLA